MVGLRDYGTREEGERLGPGWVWPGDPELLTVKAVRLIERADVVLHDDLVPQAILDLASHAAEIVHVGKRCGSG